ncbi:MAG: carbonic anhydrase [Methanobrevibacter sp.]|nr:carbonic anhydrase [Methanobrevibacter sp.]MBQ2353158.1 carbonic anhydrase [Methanobrevibacter sp.]
MTVLDDVLKDNREFVENFQGIEMSHHAAKNLVILTCMDCRLIEFLEPALGLDRGDAKIVRNAGNSIVGEDAIRSIGAALYNLDANEVLVVGHTDCGMASADADELKEKMIARGIKEEDIAKYDLAEWIGGFDDEEENVRNVVEKIKSHPLIPEVPVHGAIIDIVTGELKVLVDGY